MTAGNEANSVYTEFASSPAVIVYGVHFLCTRNLHTLLKSSLFAYTLFVYSEFVSFPAVIVYCVHLFVYTEFASFSAVIVFCVHLSMLFTAFFSQQKDVIFLTFCFSRMHFDEQQLINPFTRKQNFDLVKI